MYRQNSRGKLLKLRDIRPRRWEYVELSDLLREEVAGSLKRMEKPKTDVVRQISDLRSSARSFAGGERNNDNLRETAEWRIVVVQKWLAARLRCRYQ